MIPSTNVLGANLNNVLGPHLVFDSPQSPDVARKSLSMGWKHIGTSSERPGDEPVLF